MGDGMFPGTFFNPGLYMRCFLNYDDRKMLLWKTRSFVFPACVYSFIFLLKLLMKRKLSFSYLNKLWLK